jgi:hypothetical protein
MLEWFIEFFGGIRRFVNFPNFNSPAERAESDSIRRDPLETRDPFLTFNCVEMKWPLVDRAGIEEGNFFRKALKRRKS